MIYIIPLEGTCNRMRAIHSAYYLSEKIKKKIKVIWLRDQRLNCSFKELFQPIQTPYFEIVENLHAGQYLLGLNRYPSYLPRISQKFYFDKIFNDVENKMLMNNKFDYTDIANYSNVLIKTCLHFYETDNDFRLFKPIQKLQQRVDNITSHFNNTIGIHIRRSDNIHAIENSPNHLFYAAMDHEISKNNSCNFYLASDSAEVKKEFKEKYGDKIITFQTDPSRNTVSGIQDGVVDLYCLANTDKIYGSFFSSFSTAASKIYNIPLVRLRLNPQFFDHEDQVKPELS